MYLFLYIIYVYILLYLFVYIYIHLHVINVYVRFIPFIYNVPTIHFLRAISWAGSAKTTLKAILENNPDILDDADLREGQKICLLLCSASPVA